MSAERSSPRPGWLGGFREGPLGALREALPGLELVDSDLAVGEGRRVDLVGIDPTGRAVGVLFVEGRDGPATVDAILLGVLDVYAWLSRNRALLADHLELARLDPQVEPLVVLVAERYDERLLERLAGLSRDVVRCFELRQVHSKRGERTYLVPATLPFGAPEASDPTGTRALLRALSPEGAVLAEELVRRIDRIDDELERASDGQGLVWSFAGERLCALRAARSLLQGASGRREPRPIRSAADAEEFVARTMAWFGQLLGAPGAANAPASGADDDGPAGAFDPDTPILTAEEIAAFQEP